MRDLVFKIFIFGLILLALAGMAISAVPTIDGSVTLANVGGTNTISNTLTTSSNNDVIIAIIVTPQFPAIVTTLTMTDSASAISWQSQPTIQSQASPGGTLWIIYGIAAHPLSDDMITATFCVTSTTCMYGGNVNMEVFGVSGANAITPLDNSVTLNGVYTGINQVSATSNVFSTSNANDLIIFVAGGGGSARTGVPGLIGGVQSTLLSQPMPAGPWEFPEYLGVSTIQSGITASVSWSTSVANNWGVIGIEGSMIQPATSAQPIYLLNITPGASTQSLKKIRSTSPFTWNTYYPIKLYTQSTCAICNFTLTSSPSLPNLPSANSPNVSYMPPSNILTGNYVFSLLERNGTNSIITLTIDVNSLNMNDLATPLTFNNPLIQLFPNFAYCPTWTVIPTAWYIRTDLARSTLNQSNPCGDVFSNANVSFPPTVILNYTGFPSFALSLQDNTQLGTIVQDPFQLILSNTIYPSNRIVATFNTFSQYSFNPVNTSLGVAFNATFNQYFISTVVTAGGWYNYYLQIPVSNYNNPNITFQINDSATAPLYYNHYDTYCPATTSLTSNEYYSIGLADANAIRNSFTVYTQGASTATGYIMQVLEGTGISTVQVQSYYIPQSVPFILYLEGTAQEYAFEILNPGCTSLVYKGALAVPVSPITIVVNTSSTAYIINSTKVIGACKITSTTNSIYNIGCYAEDGSNNAYQYQLDFYRVTSSLGTEQPLFNTTYSGSSFIYNFTEPVNNTYSYRIYAIVYKGNGLAQFVNGGNLNNFKATLAAPLLGFVAFLLMLTLILGGASTGKPILLLLLVDIGLIMITFFIPIPIYVAILFILISILAIWWTKFK